MRDHEFKISIDETPIKACRWCMATGTPSGTISGWRYKLPDDLKKVLARKDHDPGSAFPEEVRQLLIEAHAPSRHESRVGRVLRELAAHLSIDKVVRPQELLDCTRASWRPAAAILAAAEVIGCGGWRGLGSPDEELGPALGPADESSTRSTQRSGWASCLGRGRAHAIDGAAWSAAIRDAALGPLSARQYLAGAETSHWLHDDLVAGAGVAICVTARWGDHIALREIRALFLRRAAYEARKGNARASTVAHAIATEAEKALQDRDGRDPGRVRRAVERALDSWTSRDAP